MINFCLQILYWIATTTPEIIISDQNMRKIIIFKFNPTLYRFSTLFNSNQTKPKTYYQILDVSPNAPTKIIRSNFLKKAKQFHPDHNPSSEAQEQFKILKEAYQVLKDPQRRYMYDTGISDIGNPNPDNPYQGQAHSGQSGTGFKKYYENKWYGYKPNKYYDQRDDFYERKSELHQQPSQWQQGGVYYRISGILVVIAGFLGYFYIRNRKNSRQIEQQHIRHILEGEKQDKKTKMMQRYIQSRSKIHQVKD